MNTTSAPSEELSREGVSIIDEMHGQSYPPYIQAFAAMRAIQMFRRDTLWTETTDASKAEYLRLFSMFHHAVMDALVNPLTERQARAIAGAFETFWEGPRYSREQVYSQVEKVLVDHFGTCATVHMLRGNQAILQAWDARGYGDANTVSTDGAKTFEKQLHIAEGELSSAWSLDPTEPMIAEKMIRVCMGLGSSREKMEKWFQRGQSAHAFFPSLCSAKSLYLSDRWNGNLEEQLAFSRECLAHPEYGSDAALTLWRTHTEHMRFGELSKDYFAQPEVWADIRLSFDAYFQREPDMVSMRMYYAYYAWLAGDWPKLAEQLALADPAVTDLRLLVDAPKVSPDEGVKMDVAKEAELEAAQVAAGRAVYDKMVADSKAQSGGN